MNTLDSLSKLDNAALISQFVKGNANLLSNQNLRIEAAFNSIQLLSKRDGLVATIKQLRHTSVVLLRRGSEYSSLIRQTLLQNGFTPTGTVDEAGFEHYQKSEMPEGYQVNCTPAQALWKEWWLNTRKKRANGLQLELLVSERDTWYPIRDIAWSQGTLIIRSLIGEIILQGDDQLVWLSREAPKFAAVPVPSNPESETEAIENLSPSETHRNQLVQKVEMAQKKFQAIATCTQETFPRTIPTPAPVTEGPANLAQTNLGQPIRPDMREVVAYRKGKLYITTPLGEIVVEGASLNFWWNELGEQMAN